MGKAKGLETRYHVKKLGNLDKKIDCIVLEFDDPIARVGIKAWIKEMRAQGFERVYEDVIEKLKPYGAKSKVYFFGCYGGGGHYFFDPETRQSVGRAKTPGPWGLSIDGSLAPKNDRTANKAVVTHKDGWTALSFWDYTIDSRPGANANFLTRGEYDFAEMIELATEQWPQIMRRFETAITEAA